MRYYFLLILACHLQAQACPSFVPPPSGGDYADPAARQRLDTVERFHFTPKVERLIQGESGYLGGDIGYTLEHFANHPRALSAMARLALREKTARPKGANFSVDCYFDRAIRFKPDDARVRAVFGGYLLAIKQESSALEQLEQAARLEPNNASNHYNLGLLYVRQKQYDKAREAAQQAYSLGFPLPGLRTKLQAAGHWKE
jgi:tetratricopeptide (TPR) repeat protein